MCQVPASALWKVKCNVASSYSEISESVTDITKLQTELQKRIELDLVKSKSTSIGEPISTGSAQKYWQDQKLSALVTGADFLQAS